MTYRNYNAAMQRALAAVLTLVATSAFAQTVQWHGVLSMRETRVRAPKSWTQGGTGKYDVGGHNTVNTDVLQLGVDWTPNKWLLLHADGLARNDRAAGLGRRAGFVQAYADVFNEHWRLRLGHFWLPTSRENIDPLWNSRYTITYSALNSWVGQEVRPIGADLQYAPNFYVTLGATAFQGNETMGTLMAARGWTLGNRLTVYDETVPALNARTRPFGGDYGGRFGYAERVRVQMPERAMLQIAHVDNNAEIYPGVPPEVPWRTRFNTIGTTIGTTSPATFAAEWQSGDTTVGFPGGSFKLGFNTIYGLVSYKRGANRISGRVERYATDFSHGHGHAITLAAFHDLSERSRIGIESVHASGKNAGQMWNLELRLGF